MKTVTRFVIILGFRMSYGSLLLTLQSTILTCHISIVLDLLLGVLGFDVSQKFVLNGRIIWLLKKWFLFTS